jgi:uncharacterized protein
MLHHSFIHLPGIGSETEERLWASGCLTWDDLENNSRDLFSVKKSEKIKSALEASREAAQSGEFQYFQGKLKTPEMWRLAPALLDQNQSSKIAYLDIETTGLGFPPASHSTSIAVYFDGQLHLEYDPARKADLLICHFCEENFPSHSQMLIWICVFG